jgi:hypothetical protein
VDKDSPARLAVRTPAAPDGSFHAFEYVIEAREGGTTVLRFVHSGFIDEDWGDEFVTMTGHGWDMYLHTLAEYLKHFAGRSAVYVEAEAPAATAGPQAWAVIEKGLGLTGPVKQGDRVHLIPEGLPAIDGVVDYLVPGETFLGVRTSDALYRFHGRSRLGMPDAVGHHLYADGIDPDEAKQAWQAWLDKLFA